MYYDCFCSMKYSRELCSFLSDEILRIREHVNSEIFLATWNRAGLAKVRRLRKMFLPKRAGKLNDETVLEELDWLWAVVDDISLGFNWRGRTPSVAELEEAVQIVKLERTHPWYRFDYEQYEKECLEENEKFGKYFWNYEEEVFLY